MKKLILLMLISFSAFSQKAAFNKIKNQGDFIEYETKNGNILKIGDTLLIKYPFSGNSFNFITQGGTQTSLILTNKKIVITKIKSIGTKNSGYKIFTQFKGFGLIPIYIDYESALDTGEIHDPFISHK